ncbi:MAG: NUDIX domain-containing protein [Chloroflexi bacterium]|nr:NUDIX domain-containing protein [Chloroflexota bacterium]
MYAYCPYDGTALGSREIDGRLRPTCPRCGFAYFKRVQIGANCVIERDGQVVLVRLNYGPRDGCWALPGGLVEPEETVEQAARRETTEETGYEVALDSLLSTWTRPGLETLIVTFRARVLRGELRPAPLEASEARWFGRDELPPEWELAWPSTVHALRVWQGRTAPVRNPFRGL